MKQQALPTPDTGRAAVGPAFLGVTRLVWCLSRRPELPGSVPVSEPPWCPPKCPPSPRLPSASLRAWTPCSPGGVPLHVSLLSPCVMQQQSPRRIRGTSVPTRLPTRLEIQIPEKSGSCRLCDLQDLSLGAIRGRVAARDGALVPARVYSTPRNTSLPGTALQPWLWSRVVVPRPLRFPPALLGKPLHVSLAANTNTSPPGPAESASSCKHRRAQDKGTPAHGSRNETQTAAGGAATSCP